MTNCPLCNGTGKWQTLELTRQEKIKEAKKLKEAGLSIQQIMRVMGYKSNISIQLLLKS